MKTKKKRQQTERSYCTGTTTEFMLQMKQNGGNADAAWKRYDRIRNQEFKRMMNQRDGSAKDNDRAV